MKKAFFSFYYDEDNWRVQQIRNIGQVSNDQILEPNAWEQIKRQGENAIKKWINNQINKSDIVIVLIGENTYRRPWVQYEIEYSLEVGKRIMGIYIHKLKDSNGKTSTKGKNPFDYVQNPRRSSVELFEPSSYNPYSDITRKLNSI